MPKGSSRLCQLSQGTNSCHLGPFISWGDQPSWGDQGRGVSWNAALSLLKLGKSPLGSWSPSNLLPCAVPGVSNHSSLQEALQSVCTSPVGPGASVEF